LTAAGVNDPGYRGYRSKKLLRKKKNESWAMRLLKGRFMTAEGIRA
jgi:hypothetical protein